MSAPGLFGLASNDICFRARWPQLSDFPTLSAPLDPTTLPRYLCSPAVLCPSARGNFTVGKNAMVTPSKPVLPPIHPAVGCGPSRAPWAGHRNISKRQEAKVPSVSLKQMLHRDDSKSL